MLLDGGAHPVDLGVAGDGGVVDVNHDHLIVPGEEKMNLDQERNHLLTYKWSLGQPSRS